MKAGKKWESGVNRYYGERRWVYHACLNPAWLESQLASLM